MYGRGDPHLGDVQRDGIINEKGNPAVVFGSGICNRVGIRFCAWNVYLDADGGDGYFMWRHQYHLVVA